MLLHQDESQEAASVTTAKVIYSRSVVMEAKTNRCCSIQAAEVACSKATSEAEAQKTSQAVMFQEEHYKYMQSLEEQAFREESRSHHKVLLLSGCPVPQSTAA